MKAQESTLAEKFFESIREKSVWKIISSESEFPWCDAIIDRYAEKWDWKELSLNSGINWSNEMLEKYQNRIDWNHFSSLIMGNYNGLNKLDCAMIAFLEKWKNRLDWEEMSKRISSPAIIDAFIEYWDWSEIIDSYHINWSRELFEKYQPYLSTIDVTQLASSRMWDEMLNIDAKILMGKILSE